MKALADAGHDVAGTKSIGGRPITTVRLKAPVRWARFQIPAIEVPAPQGVSAETARIRARRGSRSCATPTGSRKRTRSRRSSRSFRTSSGTATACARRSTRTLACRWAAASRSSSTTARFWTSSTSSARRARPRRHTGPRTTPFARCTPIREDFCRRLSPPRAPRFQSRRTATPFGSTPDAFELRPDVSSLRADRRPSARRISPTRVAPHTASRGGGGGDGDAAVAGRWTWTTRCAGSRGGSRGRTWSCPARRRWRRARTRCRRALRGKPVRAGDAARLRGERRRGAFYLTLVPIRPRRRGERRSLRTFSPGVVSLRPPLAFNPDAPRRLSTPSDAFQLHPDVRFVRENTLSRRTSRASATRATPARRRSWPSSRSPP